MVVPVLIIGRSGQVAQSLLEAGAGFPDLALTAMGRPDLDITDTASIRHALDAVNPRIVINAAAYTAVDKAEEARDAAFAANADGPGLLACETASRGVPLIHISTDYVFDGSATRPYRPDDATAPLGVYGASKLAGEQRVAEANPQHFIFRTAWVYGAYGKNFLKTMMRVAKTNPQLRVVADQQGGPTSSHDIAEALLQVASQVVRGQSDDFGLYHLAARGEAVWADFAEAIFEASAAYGGPSAKVERITTAEYPTPAVRPAYSVLDTTRLKQAFGIELPHWHEPVA
ncbi:MAG: dTDP-4-dehydrorhamnose reductase, partial [Pseudomonadota bacterium]